uniref:Uncharacterized protein n=1 Tax=Bubo bubo TaxID=30461 RepID=A0A8C0FGM5_BUBBB
MQQEILGPVLPVLTVCKLGAAIHFTNKNKRPLATYVCDLEKQMLTHSNGALFGVKPVFHFRDASLLPAVAPGSPAHYCTPLPSRRPARPC